MYLLVLHSRLLRLVIIIINKHGIYGTKRSPLFASLVGDAISKEVPQGTELFQSGG